MTETKTKTEEKQEGAGSFHELKPEPEVLENPPAVSAHPSPASPMDNLEITEEALEEFIKIARLKAQFMKKFMMEVLELTSRTDWVAFRKKDPASGNPIGNEWRLTHSGAERIMSFAGIQLSGPDGPGSLLTYSKKRAEDDGYIYRYEGMMRMKFFGAYRAYQCFGACSTSKAFHRMVNGKRKPINEIDEVDIMKDAHSDMLKRGVRGIIGFGSQGDDAMDAWFEKKGWKMPEVGFAGGGQGGNATTTDDREVQQKVAAMLKDLAGEGQEAQADYLEKMTEFKGRDGGMVSGLRSIKALKDKRLEVTYGKLKAEHAKLTGSDEAKDAVTNGNKNGNGDKKGGKK